MRQLEADILGMANVFKAYDVRGVYPDEINKELSFKIGGATVEFLKANLPAGRQGTLVVGEDCRLSSPTMRGAVIDAATRAGAKVYYIGACTTPLFYFSVDKLKADGGTMVTASHNPPQYGGLKIVGSQSRPIGSESGLKEIEKISQGEIQPARDMGKVEEVNLTDDYIDFVIQKSGIRSEKLKNLRIVVDAGNGMTPLVLGPLFEKIGIKPSLLYFDVDCSFPNHSPDISKAEALADLKRKVLETRADIGIAFDGDGDRASFLDKNGNKIGAEFILALLFKSESGFFRKPKTVYDLRASKSVKELLGGAGIRSRVGHAPIKELMRKHNAVLGGELSGHFFFKEMGYAESSMLAMLKVLKIISESNKSLDELIKPFQKYFHSGEVNMPIDNNEQGKIIIQKLKEKYKDGKVDELDGVTVEYVDWWFNLRLSNTEPIIRLVVEADTEVMMEEKRNELLKVIKNPLS